MALKGMEPAPNPQQRGGSKKLEGGSFVWYASAKTWREMTQLTKVKQNTHEHKDKSCNLKTIRQTQGPTGLYELFLLTVPIEEVARWQYIKQFW